jgi:hypothetical protein
MKNVTIEGKVNYLGFIEEKDRFELYLKYLSSHKPANSAFKNEKLAYWINTYNAFTIKLIMDNYPINSITELHPFFYIPGFNTVWHDAFFKIDGEDFDLDRIEHEILRKQFKEVRIHFAINCASKSCPNLRNEVYTASNLDHQLNDQTIRFINDKTKNILGSNKVVLSRLFSWFSEDFETAGGVLPFVRKYAKIKISDKAEITFLPYDWSLND